MANNSVVISYENARQYLVEESNNRLVLIDFWADWCAPCKALMPLLEKLAEDYGGQFMLAKVNTDELADIAAQFGIRSLPTVVAMSGGEPVDAFMGAQPESVIRAFIDKLLPKPWDEKAASAQHYLQGGDVDTAVTLLREAYGESNRQGDIALLLAAVCLQLKQLDEAKIVLDAVLLQDRGDDYQQLMAQLELMEESAHSPEISELEEKLNNDPDNLELAFELAVQLSQHNHTREALDLLYIILESDRNFRNGDAKKIYLDILATLGKGSPLAARYQRKIYNLLH